MADNSAEKWHPFEDGNSLGQPGIECGIIVWDEEDPDGARLTIASNGHVAPFSISVAIYDYIYYNAFFYTLAQARDVFQRMKPDIENILSLINQDMPDADGKRQMVGDAIKEFTAKYPSFP